MNTIDAIKFLESIGYHVKFESGGYSIRIDTLVYKFDRFNLVMLAKDLLFFG